MEAIKLYQLDRNRFQSQLYIGKASCDFYLDETEGMKIWNGGDFVKYEGSYIVVTDKTQMQSQLI